MNLFKSIFAVVLLCVVSMQVHGAVASMSMPPCPVTSTAAAPYVSAYSEAAALPPHDRLKRDLTGWAVGQGYGFKTANLMQLENLIKSMMDMP